MKLLLVGCSWTAGTDSDRPAPADYLDNGKHEIYNAGIQGSSIHLHNFLLESLLNQVQPDHVFFQLTGARRYSFQTTKTLPDTVLNDAWYEVKPNYKALKLQDGIKQHFHIITPGNAGTEAKNRTGFQKTANSDYNAWVFTDMFRHQFVQALAYTKNMLDAYSHTFIDSNGSSGYQGDPVLHKQVQKVLGKDPILPYAEIPDYQNYIVDDGQHLNPAGAKLYCENIYKVNIPSSS